jgi:mannose-6-phosphate isomerase
MRDRVYPLTFEPTLRDYLWGGRNLERLYGRRLPPGITAESWEISGHPTAPTRVAAGAWQGCTLPEVLEAMGEQLVGSRSRAMLALGRFPLLIKLLDATQDLSVQVHPSDTYALRNEGDLGKTEAWYILHAEPGATLIYGLARGTTRETFVEALRNQAVETQLHRLAVQEGDVLFVPAGTVHAIMAGIVAAEIQQNSDATYRVYDWGRVATNGDARPLHIDKALDVIDWTCVTPAKVKPVLLEQPPGVTRARLVEAPQFVIESVDLDAEADFAGVCGGETFEIWGCVQGEAEIGWQGEPVAAPAVRFVLLPAALGRYTVRAARPSRLLRIYVPT